MKQRKTRNYSKEMFDSLVGSIRKLIIHSYNSVQKLNLTFQHQLSNKSTTTTPRDININKV